MSRTPSIAPVPGVAVGDRENVTRNAPAGAGPWFLIVLAMVIGLPTAPVAGAVSAVTTRSGWNSVKGVVVAGPRLVFFSSRLAPTPLVSATAETKSAPGEAWAGRCELQGARGL